MIGTSNNVPKNQNESKANILVKEREDILQLLIAHEANILFYDNDMKTAMDYGNVAGKSG